MNKNNPGYTGLFLLQLQENIIKRENKITDLDRVLMLKIVWAVYIRDNLIGANGFVSGTSR